MDSIITGASPTVEVVLLDILDRVDLLTITIQVIMEKVVVVELDKMVVTVVPENHKVMVVVE